MSDRVVKCEGKRRITVEPTATGANLIVWYRDPPGGKRIATLVLSQVEMSKLMLTLTEVVSA